MTARDSSKASRGIHVAGVVLLLGSVAGALTLISAQSKARANEAEAREATAARGVKVLVAKAVPAPATRVVSLQGDVHPFRQATLYAKVSGYLEALHVDRGDLVRGGQVLGVIESPETAQQEISAQAELRLRQRTEQRVRALVGTGVVSQQEMDNATGGLEVAQADVSRIQALRGYEELRAPFAGRITERYVDPGALLSAATGATQSAQPVVDVTDVSRVRVFIYPGQQDAGKTHEGDKVTFWTDVDPGAKRTAEISRITHALDPRTRTMLAEFDVDNRDDAIQPGSFVHVQLTVSGGPGTVIPADAIVLRAGKPFVALVVGGRAHFVPVEVADDDGKQVVISHGVAAADVVVLHPSDDVLEDAVVQAVEAKAPVPPAAPAPVRK